MPDSKDKPKKVACANCGRPIVLAKPPYSGWVHAEKTGTYYYCPFPDAIEQNVHAQRIGGSHA